MKVFYHNDLDGKCSAAIVNYYYNIDLETESAPETTFYPINYNKRFPIEEIRENEKVIIVDYSVSNEMFYQILDITNDLVWIDHHKKAIEDNEDIRSKCKGIQDTRVAGCELTWMYFYPHKKVPKIVSYLGDYDTWKFEYPETKEVHLGIQSFDNNPTSQHWPKWIENRNNKAIDSLVVKGMAISHYKDKVNRKIVSEWAFETSLYGYSVLACNAVDCNSSLFESYDKDYISQFDIFSTFVWDGSQWSISLYSNRYSDRDDIDLSKIAAEFEGGGHAGASGFQSTYLPFN